MYIPKRYGESKIDACPFCGKISVLKNKQGIPVCRLHKNDELKDIRCVCGKWLDLNVGKWGAYFRCINCGNIGFRKAVEMNQHIKRNISQEKSAGNGQKSEKYTPKEITVNSDELDFLY